MNKTGCAQPVFTKRVAACRHTPTNFRKLQVKLGQVVYVTRRGKVYPMRVLEIEDCADWACKTYQNRGNYMIYYSLQPMRKVQGVWRATPLRPIRTRANQTWQAHNARLRAHGWLGHSVDMDDFFITHAEARWYQMT